MTVGVRKGAENKACNSRPPESVEPFTSSAVPAH